MNHLLSRLEGVKKSSNGWQAKCPVHDDRQASLSVGVGDNERILLKCFAGCTVEDIVAGIGLKMSDLFNSDGKGVRGTAHPRQTHATVQHPTKTPASTGKKALHPQKTKDSTPCNRATPSGGFTLEDYAHSKGLSVSFLTELRLRDHTYRGSPALRIPYFDESGDEVAVRVRTSSTGPDHFRWRKGDKPLLYGLWRLDKQNPTEYVVLVEGESDCHTLWYHDVPALGIPGVSIWREDRDAPHVTDFPIVYIVIEPDTGGETIKKWLGSSSIRDRARLVDLGEHKDPSGLYLNNPERFMSRWQEALERSVPWKGIEAKELEAQKQEAWLKCETLAREPYILETFAEWLHKCGFVGDSKPAKLLYLAITSRLFERPISVVVKGTSSVGKSFLVEKVLGFFPDHTYYALSGMSERALAYSDEPLSHRFLVLYEAVGLGSDFATYLMRSLLSEGQIRYEFVDKTKDGLKSKLIERQGPTGLIVTTTAPKLHPENETRLLSVPVTDTAEQTRIVMLALASDCDASVDMTSWRALQSWLETGEHRVVIPYARTLAESIPPVAVRLRRDFSAVRDLIKAHALLHRANRECDSDKRIIASIDDYAVVRELVAESISEGVEATVAKTVRETVEVVREITEESANDPQTATVSQVAKRLDLCKSSASRRVRTAIDGGYLKNHETGKGRAAQLVIGEPLPVDSVILPLPEDLEGCAVAEGCIHHRETLQPQKSQDNSIDNDSGCTVAVETGGYKVPPTPPTPETCGDCCHFSIEPGWIGCRKVSLKLRELKVCPSYEKGGHSEVGN